MPSRRHLSRIAVMQTLFEAEARGIDPGPILSRVVGQMGGVEALDLAFGHGLLKGVSERRTEICAAIERHAPQWPMSRMDPITRAILMIGGYELLLGNDAPPAVVMNEAIEVAKEYGTEESGKFVNGVLNALAHGKEPAGN